MLRIKSMIPIERYIKFFPTVWYFSFSGKIHFCSDTLVYIHMVTCRLGTVFFRLTWYFEGLFFFFFSKRKRVHSTSWKYTYLVGYVIQELGINLICGMFKKLQVNWFETDILQPWETLIYYFCSKAWLRFPLLVPPAEINPTFLLHYFQRNILLMPFARLFAVLFVII